MCKNCDFNTHIWAEDGSKTIKQELQLQQLEEWLVFTTVYLEMMIPSFHHKEIV